MIGLLIAIILFNLIAFRSNKRLTRNQTVHIWAFTIAFQLLFDIIVEFKFKGYWYFTPEPDLVGLLAHTILIPPVNMMFLDWYPFKADVIRRITYVTFWVIAILLYEVVARLPEPWGYFYYGWWELWHAALVDPILFFILVKYYRWILRLEKEMCT